MKQTCYAALLLLCAGFVACTKDKQSPAPALPLNVNCGSISYRQHIAPMISQYCSGCHDAYLDYGPLKASVDNGSFYRSLFTEQTMPLNNYLEPEELARIRCWLGQGAPEN